MSLNFSQENTEDIDSLSIQAAYNFVQYSRLMKSLGNLDFEHYDIDLYNRIREKYKTCKYSVAEVLIDMMACLVNEILNGIRDSYIEENQLEKLFEVFTEAQNGNIDKLLAIMAEGAKENYDDDGIQLINMILAVKPDFDFSLYGFKVITDENNDAVNFELI